MATPSVGTLFDEVLDFLVSSPTPEEIVAFKPSDTLQARASELLERNRSGSLTREDQSELDEFSYLNHLMSMLKIRARKKLAET
jgi:hypothetical protein